MVKIIKRVHEEVIGIEIPQCHECIFKFKSGINRNALKCKKLHAWVSPTDFCSWGERISDEDTNEGQREVSI